MKTVMYIARRFSAGWTALLIGCLAPLLVPSSSRATPLPNTAWVHGADLDGSGSLNVLDALCLVIAVLQDSVNTSIPPSCLAIPLADLEINCSAPVNIVDVQLLLWAATGAALDPGVDSTGSGVPDACENNTPALGGFIGTSCQAGLTAYPALTGQDGVYSVDPDGAGGDPACDVYCDMTSDGGGWTRVLRGTGGPTNPSSAQWDVTAAVGAVSDPTYKVSDTQLHALRNGGIYRVTHSNATRFFGSTCVYDHLSAPAPGGPCNYSFADPALTTDQYGGHISEAYAGLSDRSSHSCAPSRSIISTNSRGINDPSWIYILGNPGSPKFDACDPGYCMSTQIGCDFSLWVR